MSGVNVKVEGFDTLLKKLSAAPKTVSANIKAVMDETIVDIQTQAKRDVPVGKTKRLKNSITHRSFNFKTGGFVSAGNVSVPYAPYVEFGTGDLFQVSVYGNIQMDDLESYAQQFKGKGIKKVNLPHRPFLFTAFADHYQKMVNGIKAVSTKI